MANEGPIQQVERPPAAGCAVVEDERQTVGIPAEVQVDPAAIGAGDADGPLTHPSAFDVSVPVDASGWLAR